MKPLSLIFAATFLLVLACTPTKDSQSDREDEKRSLVAHVELNDPLDQDMIQVGTEIFLSKCARCHAMDTVEFGVPAFAGVTNRRSPEWIMNMILNVDEMLKQDPVAVDLLRKHRKVMPDPELSVDQTRSVLEFLRNNDLEQVGQKDEAARD